MKALVTELVAKADLTPEQAEKVASVVKTFVGDKLPEAVKGPILSALSGEHVDSAFDAAKNALGSLLSR